MKALNFNTVTKHYWNITLSDEKKTTLLIGMPTKAIIDDLSALQDSIEEYDNNKTNTQSGDDMYEACARMMSRNKAGIKITKEFLAEIFDFEDIVLFANGYTAFVDEIVNSKN